MVHCPVQIKHCPSVVPTKFSVLCEQNVMRLQFLRFSWIQKSGLPCNFAIPSCGVMTTQDYTNKTPVLYVTVKMLLASPKKPTNISQFDKWLFMKGFSIKNCFLFSHSPDKFQMLLWILVIEP